MNKLIMKLEFKENSTKSFRIYFDKVLVPKTDYDMSLEDYFLKINRITTNAYI